MKTYNRGQFGGALDSSKNVNLLHILRWKILQNPKFYFFAPKKKILPLAVVNDTQGLNQKEDFICWLSHASFLIQLGGKRILIDPVFGHIPFYRRQIKAPYSLNDLGDIDYLLISHTHYDHFDKTSIRAVEAMQPTAIVPLKMPKLIHKIAPAISSKELDWYESYHDEDLTITLVPAKHWGRRSFFDKNRVLWGGYIITYKDQSIYFAGDSASGSHFEEIGERYKIDIALLPIGAYKPEFIMKENHLNPQEAFDAFTQVQAKRMIPMHYGTFDLTDEPLDEPLQWMHEIAKKHPDKISFLNVGEVWEL
ncbi:MAG: MBL fold metallo-hydrolase [Sulfurovum sp.]|nr:MBL fold metallo-hydrolase [Sulfurovum sp.]